MSPISLRRSADLARLYWRTSRRTLLRLYLGLTAFFLAKTPFLFLLNTMFIFGFGGHSTSIPLYNHFIGWAFGLVCLSFLFTSLHRRPEAIGALCLPATNAEKFLTRVILGTLALVLVAELAELTSGIIHVAVIAAMDMLTGTPLTSAVANHYLAPVIWPFNLLFLGTPWAKVLAICGVFLVMGAWFTSVFTLSGLLFRRHGWAYSLAFIAVLWSALAVFVIAFDVSDADIFDRLLFAACLLFAVLHYYLAYRTFCRIQIH